MSDTAPAPIRPVRHSCEAATARHAPTALWRAEQAFLGSLHMLFGAPEDVARAHTLTAKAHKQMAQWLRCAEAMLRRLLLIEAAALPKPEARQLPRPARRRVRAPKSFDAEHPEEWRVSFRVLSSPTRGGSPDPGVRPGEGKGDVAPSDRFAISSPASGGDKKRFRSAWPLAERYEALIRVFNDPTAYARRLAARLHATPHRLADALHAPPEAQHRIADFRALSDRAKAAWRPHFSSA